MISTDLSIRGCDGHVVVTLRGELDLADAESVAATLTAVADRQPEIVVDLTGLDFIDTVGVAALARGHAGSTPGGPEATCCSPRRSGR
jgi:anti-anti-sigma factor